MRYVTFLDIFFLYGEIPFLQNALFSVFPSDLYQIHNLSFHILLL